ncbi:MAG: 2-phospho-L-lactate guanylyltransferase [Actinomycetota bacterium]
MRVIAVPVKPLSRAKTRLAKVLSPMERAALTLAMLEDVLDAAVAQPGWETWVVSPDEAALEIAVRRGVRPVQEAKGPLSAAVRQVELDAVEQGADALAVLLADLPLLTAAGLEAGLTTLGSVVLAPSASDGGTNLLLRRPPRVIGARFGRDSFDKHVEGAAARGLPTSVVREPELTTDLDMPRDLRVVLDAAKPGRTLDTLIELDAATRIAASA